MTYEYNRRDWVFARQRTGDAPEPISAPLKGWGMGAANVAGFAAFMAALIYLTCVL